MAKMVKATNKIKAKTIIALPLVLVGISLAIMLSSYILNQTQDVPYDKLLNIMATGVTLGIIATLMMIPLYLIGKTGKSMITGAILGILLFPAISLSIMLSSYILNQTQEVPYTKLLNIMATGVTLGIIATLMMIPLYLIGKAGKSMLTGAILGILIFPAISLAIMLSSYILNQGEYTKPIPIDWVLSFGLAMLIMSIPVLVLGMVSTINPFAVPLGSLAMVVVSGAIMASSMILSKGKYENAPSLEWSKGVGLAMLAFVPAILAMGTVLAIPIVGALILAGGFAAMVVVASSIVAVAEIFSKSGGVWSNYPSEEWSKGVGLAIGAFAPVFAQLNKSKVMSIFGGDAMTGKSYGKVMVTIGESILEVADVFAKGGGVWSNYPKEEWSKGVGLAIGAFAPIYSNLNSSIGGILDTVFGGDTAEKMKGAMIAIAKGIVAVDKELSSAELSQTKMDPDWAKSVSDLISGFSKAYMYIIDEGIETDDIMKSMPTLMLIAASISPISKFIGKLGEVGTFDVDLVKISEGVLAMAESIDALSESSDSLSTSSVSNLKMLTTSLIGLSVVDANNLSSTLDTLSEKEKEIKKLISTVKSEDGMGLNDLFMEVKNILPDVQVNDDKSNMVDLETKVNQMVQLLSQIASTNTGIASQLGNLGQDKEPSLDL